MSKASTLKNHMSATDRRALGDLPTTHQNCIDKTGCARPGKTARDKANGHVAYRVNRRVWSASEKAWVKI